jgi:hypothetical protein
MGKCSIEGVLECEIFWIPMIPDRKQETPPKARVMYIFNQYYEKNLVPPSAVQRVGRDSGT